MTAERTRLKKKEMAMSTSVCWHLLDYGSRTDIIATVEAVHKNKWPLQTVSQNKCQLCKKKIVKESVMFCETTKQNIICLLHVPAQIQDLGFYCIWKQHTVVQLVEALCYKPEGHGCDSQWCHWNVSLMWSFLPHYDPRVDSASKRNGYRGHYLGIKVASA
jgi:hypothetical protein